MSELTTKKKFTAEYVDPSSPNGINGGNTFERSDAMFADDVNRIVKNQMALKEAVDKKSDIGHKHSAEELVNHSHSPVDITGNFIRGEGGTIVKRGYLGDYTVSSPVTKLVGYRYEQQNVKYETVYNYSSSKLTENKDLGEIQVLFLRLYKNGGGYVIDIPIDMLVLMFHTQQAVEILNVYSDAVRMQVTDCRVSRLNPSHKYLDIDVTIKFSYYSRSSSDVGAIRAEWWGRPLENITGYSGYYDEPKGY